MKKDLEFYLSLEYALRMYPDPEGGYVASIPDLPGCFGAGDTKKDALEDLEDSRSMWLRSYFETHGEAPEPSEPKTFSGRFLVRLPKTLHETLHDAARSDCVSLNQYVVSLLAERNAANRSVRHLAILYPQSGQHSPWFETWGTNRSVPGDVWETIQITSTIDLRGATTPIGNPISGDLVHAASFLKIADTSEVGK